MPCPDSLHKHCQLDLGYTARCDLRFVELHLVYHRRLYGRQGRRLGPAASSQFAVHKDLNRRPSSRWRGGFLLGAFSVCERVMG